MKMLRITLAALLFFSQPLFLFAGTTGKISGYVKDKASKQGLLGVSIQIEGTTRGTQSDPDGYFSQINLSPGSYTLVFRYIGYSSLRIASIEVNVDRTTVINAEMEESAVNVAEVVVNTKRPPIQKDRTYSASVVGTKTIETLPVTSINELIALQPGVVSSGGSLHFRGGRSREVAYLIDGIPVSNSFDQGGGNNVNVENSMVQELEVISGTFNAEYGNAQSGIVNIITKGITNEFSSSASFYTGDWLSSHKDIFLGIQNFNPLSEKDLQFSVAGPIATNLLSFSVNGRYNKSESMSWYERRYNAIDGWKIAAYHRWFREQRSSELGSTQGIPIPDSLMTGNLEQGPLAKYDNLTLSGKINYNPLPSLVLTYHTFFSLGKSSGTTDRSRRYQPDEVSEGHSNANHHFFTIKNFPSEKFFWNIGFSYQLNDYESYYRKDNKLAEYPGDNGIQPISTSTDGFSLGTTSGFYSDAEGKNYRKLMLLNGSLNWQIDKYNFVKAGFEVKKHEVNTYGWGYVETKEWETYKWPVYGRDSTLTFGDYWTQLKEYWRTWDSEFGTTKYRKYREDEYYNWRDYTIEPIEYAFYIQDKIEFGELIINAGLRLDAFNPNESVPINYRTESYLLGTEANLKKAETKIQLSPRFGLSFPISDKGVFHAAYGHFFQMPSFAKMYNEPLYALTAIQLEGRTLGNADLKPETTIQYELGLQQQISDDIAADITAYYKDYKNLLGVENITTIDAVAYKRFINRDYGYSRGITLGLRKTSGFVNGAINYSYSFASGSASDPEKINLIYASTQIGGEPFAFVDRKILPLDWDQRHTLNMILNFSQVQNWNLSLVAYLNSGQPYSPTFIEKYDILEQEYTNRAEKPVKWGVDLKFQKHLKFGSISTILFIKIDNLFDTLNENSVYSTSGNASENIRLPEVEALEKERLLQENNFSLNEIDVRPEWYSSPRKIQIGIELSL